MDIELQRKRWLELYDEDAHAKLQCAVMNQVAVNRINRKKDRIARRKQIVAEGVAVVEV